jgi:hypothetical protein
MDDKLPPVRLGDTIGFLAYCALLAVGIWAIRHFN